MNEPSPLSSMVKLAKISSIVGLCTIGICPAFGAIGLVVPIVIKNKNVKISDKENDDLKIAKKLSIISLVLFFIEITVAFIFFTK